MLKLTSFPPLNASLQDLFLVSSFASACFIYFSLLLLFPSCLHLFASLTCPMAPSVNRWLRPEVYPLFAAVGTVVGVCVMQLLRNITTNPDVRVLKEKRTAGVLDNLDEGEKYREHGLRKYVRNKAPQIMPSVNGFFSKPNSKGDY